MLLGHARSRGLVRARWCVCVRVRVRVRVYVCARVSVYSAVAMQHVLACMYKGVRERCSMPFVCVCVCGRVLVHVST